MFQNTSKAWASVFAIGGITYCATGIFFIIFGTADTQPWNEKLEDKPGSSSDAPQ